MYETFGSPLLDNVFSLTHFISLVISFILTLIVHDYLISLLTTNKYVLSNSSLFLTWLLNFIISFLVQTLSHLLFCRMSRIGWCCAGMFEFIVPCVHDWFPSLKWLLVYCVNFVHNGISLLGKTLYRWVFSSLCTLSFLNLFIFSFLPIPKQKNQIRLNCLRYRHTISHHLPSVEKSWIAKSLKEEVLATTTRTKDIICQCPKKRLDQLNKKVVKQEPSNNSEA
jgi:hypothetical protein